MGILIAQGASRDGVGVKSNNRETPSPVSLNRGSLIIELYQRFKKKGKKEREREKKREVKGDRREEQGYA